MQGRSKMQPVNVVVLSDCLFFLVENSNKLTFFKPENKVTHLVKIRVFLYLFKYCIFIGWCCFFTQTADQRKGPRIPYYLHHFLKPIESGNV